MSIAHCRDPLIAPIRWQHRVRVANPVGPLTVASPQMLTSSSQPASPCWLPPHPGEDGRHPSVAVMTQLQSGEPSPRWVWPQALLLPGSA